MATKRYKIEDLQLGKGVSVSELNNIVDTVIFLDNIEYIDGDNQGYSGLCR